MIKHLIKLKKFLVGLCNSRYQNKVKATKIKQSKQDLQQHLDEQLGFLKKSAEIYDNGDLAEAKRLASTIRLLVHDTKGSKSLLRQLEVKDSVLFYDSAGLNKKGMLNMGASLVVLMAPEEDAIPILDDSPPETAIKVKFEDYWNREVLFAGNRHFTRKELVLTIANQDGGVHVDPKLTEEYVDLSRNHSFGWKVGTSEVPERDVEVVELASVRQIAHEILRTLASDYPHQNMKAKGRAAMYPRFFVQKTN